MFLVILVVSVLKGVLEIIWRSFGRRWEDVGKSLGRHWKVFGNTMGSGLEAVLKSLKIEVVGKSLGCCWVVVFIMHLMNVLVYLSCLIYLFLL